MEVTIKLWHVLFGIGALLLIGYATFEIGRLYRNYDNLNGKRGKPNEKNTNCISRKAAKTR